MSPSPLKFVLLPTLLLAPVCLLSASAQNTPEQTPSLTVTTRLVVLDVTVTDAAGKPVTDLKREDFRVFDDNQPRELRSFDPPAAHTLPASASAANVPDALKVTFDPANPRAFGQSPVTILLLDQLNTHFTDSSYARRELHDFLLRQPALLSQPTTLLTIFDNRSRTLAPFTRDRESLLKALAAAPVKNAWQLEQTGTADEGPLDRMQQSLEAIEGIAAQYARIPGRKNLLWVGGGFSSPDPGEIDGPDALEVRNTVRHVTNLLLEQRMTLYAVDPTSTAAGLTEITTEEQSNFATAAGMVTSGIDPFNASADFDKLAPVTGGRVIRGRNDISAQIASALTLAANFYTLGYAPDGAPTGNPYRHIRVECLRSGLHVLTREGYYAASAAERAPALAVEQGSLSNALRSSVPWNELHVTVERLPDDGGKQDRFMVHVGAADLNWAPERNGTLTAHVTVAVAAFSGGNKVVEQASLAQTADTPGSTDVHAPSHHADFRIALPKHAHEDRLRIAVADKANGRIGAVDVP